jgi:hypothetical protein
VCPDGAGGWFIGGQFTAVDGAPRTHIARIGANRILQRWSPELDGPVEALTVSSGVLYVGGGFRSVDGQSRNSFASFEVASGRLLSLQARVTITPPDFASINAIAIRGNHILFGGAFDTVNGVPRSNLAEINAAGVLTPWDPAPDQPVHALAVVDSAVYVGGEFTQCGDSSRTALAAIDGHGLAMPWAPRLQLVGGGVIGLRVLALCRSGDSLVVGGRFTQVDGLARRCLAAFDLNSGAVTSFDLQIASTLGVPLVNALEEEDGILYAAGFFARAGSVERNHLLAFDLVHGLQAWNPRADGEVYAIAASPTTIFAGGRFGSVGEWQMRSALAALDLVSGKATAWNPSPDDVVYTIAPANGKVHVGGSFSSIGGSPRSNLAAIDSSSSLATNWRPDPGSAVTALAISEGRLYAGGYFTQVSGQPRRYAAAFDLDTDSLTAWNADAQDYVDDMAIHDGHVYLAGFFQGIGMTQNQYLARVDPLSGVADVWDAKVNSFVLAMAVTDSLLYLGGPFSAVGGEPRNHLAAVHVASGSLSAWTPDPQPRFLLSPSVDALAVSDGVVYAGGDFVLEGHPSLVAFRADLGTVLPWWPEPDARVWTIHPTADAIYVGGIFQSLNGRPCGGLAALNPLTVPTDGGTGSVAILEQNAPNPVSNATRIRFRLPSESEVSLTIYDLQGRVRARLLDRSVLPPGNHEVTASVAPLPPGCYLYSLTAAGETTTRKMLVLK